jgi:hypothetical protein
MSSTEYRRRASRAAATERRSTQVAPLGTHTSAFFRSGPPEVRALRRKPSSISAVASRSAITPSRSGWMTLMSCGSFSARASAALPMATTAPVLASIAIADGSSSTIPRPPTQMSVLTVPRSIATLPRMRIIAYLLSHLTPAALVVHV